MVLYFDIKIVILLLPRTAILRMNVVVIWVVVMIRTLEVPSTNVCLRDRLFLMRFLVVFLYPSK
jgi:hypothetical protein